MCLDGVTFAGSYWIMNKTITCKKTKIKNCGEAKIPLDKRKPLMEAATVRSCEKMRSRASWQAKPPAPPLQTLDCRGGEGTFACRFKFFTASNGRGSART